MYIKSKRLRNILRAAVPALLALTVAMSLGRKNYMLFAAAAAVLAILLFAAGIEKKRSASRRLVLTAVMTALSVISRLLPVLKPVTAVTVISGVYLGPEAGFMTGAFGALISNIYFGQGPWTPFQMAAWGFIGWLSGLLSKKLKKGRLFITLWGLFTGIFYSAFMDVFTVVWYSGGFDVGAYLPALVSALPFTALYCFSNCLFLFFLKEPFGRKLDRIRLKYGL